jgi:(4S)-4-hydroxy-5-phosphonooxypentane-2,3-dione isomerase
MHVVTVLFRIKSGSERLFLERVSAQARASLEGEAGCLQFDVCVSDNDPGEVFLYELYEDSAAFDLHLQTSHFLSFDAAARPDVLEKTVRRWNRVEPR